ncbi:MAG: zf-HC2 domain-containing protein [Mycobacteriaceae bacterium]
MTDPADPYLLWDAAYVLGSLSSSERREYEMHLSGCRACRAAVGEISGMPALLTMLSREEVSSIDDGGIQPPPMRPQLLDDLLDQVSRRRRRARWRMGMASAAAAAVLAGVLLIAVKPGPQLPAPAGPPSASAMSMTMTPVAPSALEAAISVTSQGWGTRIQMTCTYHQETTGGEPTDGNGDELAMVAVGRDGTRIQLATWMALEGGTASPAGSTSTPIDEIAAVQVVSAGSGQVLLQRSL